MLTWRAVLGRLGVASASVLPTGEHKGLAPQLGTAACLRKSDPVMVRIIDGEIVADDDPRVAGPARRVAGPGAGASAASGGGGGGSGAAAPPQRRSVFDFNQPPLRLAPDDGTGLGGLPGLFIFGARAPPQHLLMLAAALLLFGWKGALIAALLWFWLQQSGGGAGGRQGQQAGAGRQVGQQAGNQQQRMAVAQDYFQSMLGQAPLGRGGAAGQGGSNAPSGAAERPAGADPWAARGKPRRLNDTQ